jgi:hypothetical protein
LHPQLDQLWRTRPALIPKAAWVTPPDAPVDPAEGNGLLLKEIDGNVFLRWQILI